MKKSDNRNIQYYNDQFINGVLNGRHPNSFPRNSELYQLYNKSMGRVHHSSQGKDILQLASTLDSSSCDADDMSYLQESQTASRQRIMKSQHDTQKTQDEPRIQSINGIRVEMTKGAHIHYGMSVVIKNFAGEVMCVNKFDELRSKAIADLLPTDKIVFQLIDIRESSNAASINFGDPIWMKSIDNYTDYANDSSTSASFALAGRIIGAKVFEPPNVTSIQEQFRKTNLSNFDVKAEELATKRDKLVDKDGLGLSPAEKSQDSSMMKQPVEGKACFYLV
jgi:hypothetical protein